MLLFNQLPFSTHQKSQLKAVDGFILLFGIYFPQKSLANGSQAEIWHPIKMFIKIHQNTRSSKMIADHIKSFERQVQYLMEEFSVSALFDEKLSHERKCTAEKLLKSLQPAVFASGKLISFSNQSILYMGRFSYLSADLRVSSVNYRWQRPS